MQSLCANKDLPAGRTWVVVIFKVLSITASLLGGVDDRNAVRELVRDKHQAAGEGRAHAQRGISYADGEFEDPIPLEFANGTVRVVGDIDAVAVHGGNYADAERAGEASGCAH